MCIAVELDASFDYAEKINIYNDGAIIVYSNGDKRFDEILIGWKTMIESAHEMPAFGVSLNKETQVAKNSGVWVEFVFGNVLESNGMPYKMLLVHVQKCSQGFNLIRYNCKSGYDGRCFYYDLIGKDMSNFYNILVNF